MDDTVVRARRREIAVEHVLFKTIEYVEKQHPGLLDFIENSLDHVGDPAHDESKDDEAVRGIVRKMLVGARREGTSPNDKVNQLAPIEEAANEAEAHPT